MSDFVRQNGSSCDFGTSDSWVILSPIELSIKRKIEAAGTPLKDWDINIYRGVLTGCNEAFIINREKRDEILQNCETDDERERTAELIRPILRGRDIKRYGYVENGLFLINTHNGLKDKGIPPIDVNEYPAIKAHLDKYWDKISVRADKGVTPYNLRNCAYLEDFDKPKIVYIEIMTDNINEGYLFPCFSYDKANAIVLNTGYIMTSNSFDVRYVLGILNSSLGRFLVKLYVSQLQSRQFRMLSQYVERFPIALPADNKICERIIMSVQEQITNSKDTYNSPISLDINSCVYELYGLTDEEIKWIDSMER